MALTLARVAGLAVFALLPASTMAQEWPKLLFKTTSYDFGVVARGAVAEYRFPIENPFVEDVHIASISSTCGCTTPTVTKPLLKTWERGEIVVPLDTRRFLGQKDVTLTVDFDQPFPAKFQLKVTAYIRADVVFEPGSVQFGSVAQGQGSRKRVSISYAGRPTWKIVQAETSASYLGLELAEVGRQVTPKATGSVAQVTYDLWVDLKPTAPTGYFKEHVFVQTNDPNPQTARIPLTVEGLIVPALSVNPAVLMLGVVPSGQSVSRNLVVRAPKPFRIVEVIGPDNQFRFALPQAAKEVQIIAVQFEAGDRAGRVLGTIRIKTDLPGSSELTVSVDGQVIPPSTEKATHRPADSTVQ